MVPTLFPNMESKCEILILCIVLRTWLGMNAANHLSIPLRPLGIHTQHRVIHFGCRMSHPPLKSCAGSAIPYHVVSQA